MKPLQMLIMLFSDEETLERDEILPGFSAIRIVFSGHFRRFGLYNPLGLAAAGVFTWTLFSPWWNAHAYNGQHTIRAYAMILCHDLPPGAHHFVIETPRIAVYAIVLLLAGYLFLAFWGATMRGKKGGRFMAWTGLSMLLYTAGFYGSLLFACGRVGQPVTGNSTIDYTIPIDLYMGFSSHYYLAMGAGAVCMLSALIHGKPAIRLRT